MRAGATTETGATRTLRDTLVIVGVALTMGLGPQLTADAGELPDARGIDDACRPTSQTVARFADVARTSQHAGAIDCLWTYDIVQGRLVDGAPVYRPDAAVTRQQLATFMGNTLRLIPDRHYELLDAGADPDFLDAEAISPAHLTNVALLQEVGVTVGYDDGTFRPTRPIHRGQMASFVAQTIEDVTGAQLPRAQVFDDLREPHDENVEKLAAIGVVQGRQERSYEPDAATTRAQMASFVARALDYLAAEGYLVPTAYAPASLATGTSGSISAIDLTAHEGGDRATFTLDGDEGSIGYRVRYVDEAVEHGSGDVVDIAGDAILQVVFTGITDYSALEDRITLDGEGIVEVVDLGVFEGRHLHYIGTTGMTWFDVEELDGPQRIAVDVRHP